MNDLTSAEIWSLYKKDFAHFDDGESVFCKAFIISIDRLREAIKECDPEYSVNPWIN